MANITTQDRIARQLDSWVMDTDGLSMLQHFDYPETWSYEGNAAFTAGGAKFGKGCVHFPDTSSKAVVTNNTGMFDLSPLGNYEAECFVKFSDTNSSGSILKFGNLALTVNNDTIKMFNNALNTTQNSGYSFYGRHAFKYFSNTLTWADAKTACENLGGHLATSTSAEKNAFLATLTTAVAWLGGTDKAEEGTWLWITGEEWSYTNWHDNPSQPDNYQGTQHYLEINFGSSGNWGDDNATSTYGYICEWDFDVSADAFVPATSISLASNTFNLERSKLMLVDASGYSFYGGHTFKYFSNALYWEQAKAACEHLGGHLATSTSSEKNAFLMSLSNNSAIHLGCSYNSETWQWITGEEWSYTNWTENWPSNADTNPYGYINAGGAWMNGSTNYWGYVCEWDFDMRDLSPYDNSTWVNAWHHLLLRITDGYAYIFVDGVQALKAYISSQTAIAPERVELGGYVGYMDEFAFRRNAGTGTPTVPTEAYEMSTPTKIPTKDAPVTRVAWSAEGLPEGLTLSESGQLTGHPTTAGSYDSTVTVTTNWGTASKTVRIVVNS